MLWLLNVRLLEFAKHRLAANRILASGVAVSSCNDRDHRATFAQDGCGAATVICVNDISSYSVPVVRLAHLVGATTSAASNKRPRHERNFLYKTCRYTKAMCERLVRSILCVPQGVGISKQILCVLLDEIGDWSRMRIYAKL
jgi:hypothetical protein